MFQNSKLVSHGKKRALKDPEQANKREPRHPFLQSVFTFLNSMALVYVRLIDKRIEKERKRILKY